MKRTSLRQKFKTLINYPFVHKAQEHRPDFIFIIALGIVCFLGLLMLSSASSVQAFQKFGDSYYFLKHQITRGFLPGLIAFFIFSRFDYRQWKKYAFWLLLASILLLILVFIPGIGASYGKAHSWIIIGPLGFQPSEIGKILFIF